MTPAMSYFSPVSQAYWSWVKELNEGLRPGSCSLGNSDGSGKTEKQDSASRTKPEASAQVQDFPIQRRPGVFSDRRICYNRHPRLDLCLCRKPEEAPRLGRCQCSKSLNPGPSSGSGIPASHLCHVARPSPLLELPYESLPFPDSYIIIIVVTGTTQGAARLS